MQKNSYFKTNLAPNICPVIDQKTRISIALIEHVKPTHFITLSLCQGRKIEGMHGSQKWVSGDDVIYDEAYSGYVRSLSKLVTRRSFWDKYKLSLRNAGIIEGGNRIERNHMHIIIAKPGDVSEERFRIMAYRAAARNSWIMNGGHSVDIQSIKNSVEAVYATFYSMKRGVDRICMG